MSSENNELLNLIGLGKSSAKKTYYKELEHEKLYSNSIIDAATLVAIISTDTNGVITKFNKGAEIMLGYSANEIEGKCSPLKFHDISEIEKRSSELSSLYKKEINGFEAFIYLANLNGSDEREWTYIKKNSEKIIITLLVTAIKRNEDTVIGYLGIAKDITWEKESKNIIISMMDAMPSMIVGVDHNLQITHWNKTAELLTNKKLDHVLGRDVCREIPNFSNYRTILTETMEGMKNFNRRVSVEADSGQKEFYDLNFSPYITNEIKGLVIRIDNVTERIKMEEMIVQSEKMMSVGGLAAGMAHEINNPLAGIIQNAQNIERRLFEPITKNVAEANNLGLDFNSIVKYMENRGINKMVDGIISSGLRASEIVQNMLSFSKNSNNKFVKIGLIELIDKTISIIKSDFHYVKSLDFNNIIIKKDYDKDMPPISCDSSKIQQVIYNLLKNGAEAMAHVEHPIFLVKAYKKNEWQFIEIEDNGVGMSEEIQRRIFEPFFTTKGLSKGTGLGMSVSYFIIKDLHNGELSVESVQNRWTRFTIKLPDKE
ncbi:MAG: PAS domain-containing protein [Spirochaetales bacterium]|nr:PAS domain-containing protein [Spirochaetales bacterium]